MGLLDKIKGLLTRKSEEGTSTEPEEFLAEGSSTVESSPEEESGDSTSNW
tara:strand:+ start:256 stop:405 length:150 start_codon:yes stop_codon:yes gene_type:complete